MAPTEGKAFPATELRVAQAASFVRSACLDPLGFSPSHETADSVASDADRLRGLARRKKEVLLGRVEVQLEQMPIVRHEDTPAALRRFALHLLKSVPHRDDSPLRLDKCCTHFVQKPFDLLGRKRPPECSIRNLV